MLKNTKFRLDSKYTWLLCY